VVHIAASSEGHAHRAYDITNPTLLLVRPDNYIGCAVDATEPAAIDAYLNRIAPPKVPA
jgi:hypothetical protein